MLYKLELALKAIKDAHLTLKLKCYIGQREVEYLGSSSRSSSPDELLELLLRLDDGNADSVGATDDSDSATTKDKTLTNGDNDSDFLPEIDVHMPIMQKSERTPKPKEFEGYVTYLCAVNNLDDGPVILDEAMSRPDAGRWKQAMKDELDSFDENQAWDLVDAPDSGTIVQSNEENNEELLRDIEHLIEAAGEEGTTAEDFVSVDKRIDYRRRSSDEENNDVEAEGLGKQK
ncbi:hypothetical protein QE152_g25878 [Popillia japonica]|uniref:Uncharacterized protein n=1 Tax=Popillia japonica TaxID=7064 RepID=A0AAW1K070_POPJA